MKNLNWQKSGLSGTLYARAYAIEQIAEHRYKLWHHNRVLFVGTLAQCKAEAHKIINGK